ncbi:unnamed protein product [Protopolystoma xenopodis]|uniref:Uncharacterized protein n=1 Tax=Protopolystoma xenopodis TaxID=117903 RepID=A0A448XEK9_9PLAT|nr:unnamed protein product [Protopolystoma xenopodis]
MEPLRAPQGAFLRGLGHQLGGEKVELTLYRQHVCPTVGGEIERALNSRDDIERRSFRDGNIGIRGLPPASRVQYSRPRQICHNRLSVSYRSNHPRCQSGPENRRVSRLYLPPVHLSPSSFAPLPPAQRSPVFQGWRVKCHHCCPVASPGSTLGGVGDCRRDDSCRWAKRSAPDRHVKRIVNL